MKNSKAGNSSANITPKPSSDWRGRVPTSIKTPFLSGLLVLAIFISGFGIWAFRAPLAGAAIAPGVVVASGQNQKIGHLEGGIVREIAVREGEGVKSGQPLVMLDETQAQSSANRVDQSIIALSAAQARAMAELMEKGEIVFPDDLLLKARNTGNEELLALQRAEFASKLEQHNSELGILEQQVRAIGEEVSGIKLQISAEKRKLAVLKAELEIKKSLLEKGLTSVSQYNALLRSEAETEGAIGALTATIGQRNKSVSEVRERQQALRASRRAQASTQINEARQQIADLQEQLTSRSDILERMIIRAPVEGVIVNISKNTIGSVVAPGETVLEILPTSNDLVISARVSPADIDVIKIGQEASIRFVALNARTTPEVGATVDYVSADRLMDEATREPYFDARLRLGETLPESFDPGQIYPGMPVDAFIKTGDRTFVEYLLKPVTDSFSKAFREE